MPANPKRFSPALSVRDIDLASALVAVGVPPDPRGFHEKIHNTDTGRTVSEWRFLDRTRDGADRTMGLIDAWGDHLEFNEMHPEHRFAYISCAFMNRRYLRAMTKETPPMVMLRRGSGLALVDPRSPAATQDRILATFGI